MEIRTKLALWPDPPDPLHWNASLISATISILSIIRWIPRSWSYFQKEVTNATVTTKQTVVIQVRMQYARIGYLSLNTALHQIGAILKVLHMKLYILMDNKQNNCFWYLCNYPQDTLKSYKLPRELLIFSAFKWYVWMNCSISLGWLWEKQRWN